MSLGCCTDSVFLLVRPSNWRLFNVQKHFVSVLVIEWRDPNDHFVTTICYDNSQVLTLVYLGPTNQGCDRAQYRVAFLVRYILESRRKNSIQGPIWRGQSLRGGCSLDRQVRCSQASDLYKGSGSCEGSLGRWLSRHRRTGLYLPKIFSRASDIETTLLLYR